MKAKVIIGANYGDEGKGTVVATYTKHASGRVLNVLTNGGAQRGHSILTEDGSFTFKHFGAGTYHGADNFYSSFFILNPMQFADEYNQLNAKGLLNGTRIFRDKNCRWSTPYDMLANQIIEQQRGENKHGSCGMGIWETVLRYQTCPTFGFDEFCGLHPHMQKLILGDVKKYFEERIGEIPTEYRDVWNSPDLIIHFLSDCLFMKEKTCALTSTEDYAEIIFENGQGLLLCDNGTDMAGTTPSKTNADYALQLASQLGCDDISLHYVSRPYMTRHGKGHLEKETNRTLLSGRIQEDRTNAFNKFQEDFRFGELDVRELAQRIKEEDARIGITHSTVLNLTHCDEMDREAEFRRYFADLVTYDSPLIK